MSFSYVYSGGALTLVPTATQTANYTASVNDLVIVDGTSGSPVITLPTAPPNLSAVGVKRYDATYASANVPTIAAGGSDAFLGGGTTALQLPLQGQVFILQYNSATAQWFVRSTDEPLSGLDGRYPGSGFSAADNGWISWNYDSALAYQFTALTGGQTYLALLPIRATTTITNVIVTVVAGSGLTSGQNFAGLYNSAGTLLSATADQTTNWASTGVKVMALTTPQPVTAGAFYYVALLSNGTTKISPLYNAGLAGTVNGFGTTTRLAVDTTHTGLTALRSTVTLTGASTPLFWAAVS